jgi:hypothetical protein
MKKHVTNNVTTPAAQKVTKDGYFELPRLRTVIREWLGYDRAELILKGRFAPLGVFV